MPWWAREKLYDCWCADVKGGSLLGGSLLGGVAILNLCADLIIRN